MSVATRPHRRGRTSTPATPQKGARRVRGRWSKLKRVWLRVALPALLLGLAGPVRAGDIVVFASWPSPTAAWGTGYGAAYSQTLIPLVGFEFEAAQQPGALTGESMTTFSASAFLVPPIGPLTPYGGLGFGFFRQKIDERSDTGTYHALILGAKLKLGSILVLRGDWRRISLSGEPLIPVDYRVSIGAGLSF